MKKLLLPVLFLGGLLFMGAASVGIERERPEPGQVRTLEVEKIKPETERKHFETNKTKMVLGEFSSESKAKEIGRDRHFTSYDNGIVMDTKTGLEWIAGPDRDTTWDEARSWVERLTVESGGWRMPTREELRTLYEKGIGTRNMTPLLKTTGWWIWSGVKWGISSARVISLHKGFDYSRPLDDSGHSRGFAVRSRKITT